MTENKNDKVGMTEVPVGNASKVNGLSLFTAINSGVSTLFFLGAVVDGVTSNTNPFPKLLGGVLLGAATAGLTWASRGRLVDEFKGAANGIVNEVALRVGKRVANEATLGGAVFGCGTVFFYGAMAALNSGDDKVATVASSAGVILTTLGGHILHRGAFVEPTKGQVYNNG